MIILDVVRSSNGVEESRCVVLGETTVAPFGPLAEGVEDAEFDVDTFGREERFGGRGGSVRI